jgi:hypothetical protein
LFGEDIEGKNDAVIQRWLLASTGLVLLSSCAPVISSTPVPTQTITSVTMSTSTPEKTATPTPTQPTPTLTPSPLPVTPTSSPPTPTLTPSPLPATPTPVPLEPTASLDETEWQTHRGQGFELEYPKGWAFFGPNGIECAALYEFFPSSLKLIRFSACWEDHVGGNQLTFAETYDRFREGFIEDALTSSTTINGVPVEIIAYESSQSNGIYRLGTSHGTVALWQQEMAGWAFIDEENQYQQNHIFDRILESFRFYTEE